MSGHATVQDAVLLGAAPHKDVRLLEPKHYAVPGQLGDERVRVVVVVLDRAADEDVALRIGR